MTSGSLFLHSSRAIGNVEPEQAVAWLGEIGLIGPPFGTDSGAFLVGPQFLELITFMGCSPYIELEPPSDGGADFCHILIHHFVRPRLLFSTNTRPPPCPACRRSLERDPAELSADPEVTAHTEIACPHCRKLSRMSEVSWRRDAGFADLFVEVRSVFPGEAVPTDGLMRRLASLGGGEWRYFYVTRDEVT